MRVMGDMTIRLSSSSDPTCTGENNFDPCVISNPPAWGLHRTDAAIDGKRVAGDVAGLLGQQPYHSVSDLVRLADPPHRGTGASAGRIAARPLRQKRRLDGAGADRIHPDVLLGVVQRRRLG